MLSLNDDSFLCVTLFKNLSYITVRKPHWNNVSSLEDLPLQLLRKFLTDIVAWFGTMCSKMMCLRTYPPALGPVSHMASWTRGICAPSQIHPGPRMGIHFCHSHEAGLPQHLPMLQMEWLAKDPHFSCPAPGVAYAPEVSCYRTSTRHLHVSDPEVQRNWSPLDILLPSSSQMDETEVRQFPMVFKKTPVFIFK